MLTTFVTATSNVSDLMLRVHETGTIIIRFKGGFNEDGAQGWWMSFIPGKNA